MASELLLVNPRRRRKAKKAGAKKSRRRVRRASTGIAVRKARKTRKYRRNPIGGAVRGFGGQLTSSLVDGGIGAGGALLAQIANNLLPLPEALKSGAIAPLAKAAIGVGVGMLVGQVVGKRVGQQMAQGAVTVALYEAGRNMLAGKVPGLSDASLLAYDIEDASLLDASLLGVGAYDTGMGYVNPAPVSSFDSSTL